MNARAIRKRLMKNRYDVLWGRRAFLTVRFPLDLIPEPRPEFTPPAGEEGSAGQWREEREDGTVIFTYIDKIGSNALPDDEDGVHYFVEKSPYGGYVWWEGERVIGHYESGEWVVDSRETLSEEYVGTYRALDRWYHKYLVGMDGPVGEETLDAFLWAANFAKTTYLRINHGYVYMTYSVKWFYPDRKRRFCAALHRAFRVAKLNGVPVKMMRY